MNVHQLPSSSRDQVSLPDPRESDLIAHIRAGDVEAFSALFSEHFASLCGLMVSYVKNAAVAEDLVQDLFCSIWKQRADWRPSGHIRHYLLAAVRNRAISYLRHERVVERNANRWATDASGEEELPGMGRRLPSADRDAEIAELADACRRAIHRLPERQRLVVTLRWQHKMSHADIGHALGISVKGVENQLTRAHKTLRKALARFRI